MALRRITPDGTWRRRNAASFMTRSAIRDMDTHLSAAAAPGNDEDESGEDEVDALMWS